jgi:hypothetical protein
MTDRRIHQTLISMKRISISKEAREGIQTKQLNQQVHHLNIHLTRNTVMQSTQRRTMASRQESYQSTQWIPR